MSFKKFGSIFFDQEKLTQEETVKTTSEVNTSDITPQTAPISFQPVATTVQPIINQEYLNCEPHMANILAKYEQGFESLNLPGYDFFEFFSAVMLAGPENPQVYDMAFVMGKSMDATLTKEKLIKDADYYLGELQKVYETFKNEGESVLKKIKTDKDMSSNELVSRVEMIKSQIEGLTNELNNANSELMTLDSKFEPQMIEIQCKLKANEVASQTLSGKIKLVKNNIK